MKKIIISNLLLLLLIAAVCAGLVWILPDKVTLCVLSIVQLLTIIGFGYHLNSHDNETEA
jgi:hypothetical protein